MPKQLDFCGLHRNEVTEEIEGYDEYLKSDLDKRYNKRNKIEASIA